MEGSDTKRGEDGGNELSGGDCRDAVDEESRGARGCGGFTPNRIRRSGDGGAVTSGDILTKREDGAL